MSMIHISEHATEQAFPDYIPNTRLGNINIFISFKAGVPEIDQRVDLVLKFSHESWPMMDHH